MDALNKKDALDWYKLIQAFRSSKQTREKTLLLWEVNDQLLLDQILKLIKTDKDEILKINLLIFLQENVQYFLEDAKVMEKVCTFLNEILNIQTNDTVGNSFHLKSQVVVTLTIIIIELNVIRTKPRVFESFIEILFDIISKINGGPDRMLRDTACQCLQEFEMVYPGLLSASLGHFLHFCQNENTHACQGYINLFATVLEHATLQLNKILEEGQSLRSPPASPANSFSASILATDADLCPFSVPTTLRLQPTNFPLVFANSYLAFARRLPETTNKEIRKCVSMLIDQATMLTPWGAYDLILKVIPLVFLSDVPKEIFLQNFFRFTSTHNSLLVHIVLILKMNFTEIFSSGYQSLVVLQLLRNTKDPNMSWERRVLCVDWLSKFPTDPGTSIVKLLNPLYRELLPSVFDPIELKNSKLKSIPYVFEPSPSPDAPPSAILSIYECIQEFRYYPGNSFLSNIMFNSIRILLEKFPELFEFIYRYLLDIVTQYPKFLDQMIIMLANISKKHPKSDIPSKFLAAINSVLISMEPSDLVKFLPLVESIVLDKSIDPTKILLALLNMLRKTTARKGSWQIGSALLSICRSVMRCHSTVAMFKPLCELLEFSSEYIDDIDIRDRAHFYYQLLTHVSGEKIQLILADPELPDDEETADLVSSAPSKSSEVLNKEITYESFLTMVPIGTREFIPSASYYKIEENQPEKISEHSKPPHEEYYEFILHKNFSPKVQKAFRIMYKADQRAVHRTRSSTDLKLYDYSQVLALVVHFGQSPIYEALPSIHLPYLCKPEGYNIRESLTQLPSIDSFPYVYNLTLSFRPYAPIPTSFQVSVNFNDPEAKPGCGAMDSISLDFLDLFLPVFIPPTSALPRSQFLDQLFDQTWTKFKEQEQEESLTPSLTKGAKSIKFLEMGFEALRPILKSKLKSFLIPVDKPLTAKQTLVEGKEPLLGVERVMIFLPPKFHLLLKFKLYQSNCIVKIRTDFWRVLICLDDFFDNLVHR